MTIPGRLPDGPRISPRVEAALAAAGPAAAEVSPDDPSRFPARAVQVERSGWKGTLGIAGLGIGGLGVLGAGAALVRSLQGGVAARPNLPTMIAFGAAALIGTTTAGLSRVVPPRTEQALAAGIPSRELAERVEARMPGSTKVVETTDGRFAVLRDTPPQRSGGGGGGGGGGSRSGGSRPSGGGYNPPSAPNYPSSGGGGSTSRGDDSGSSRNSTSNGNPSYGDF